MVRAIRALPDGSGTADKLTVVFVLIGYRDPDAVKPTPALAINDVFAPFLGLYASMGAHETHLARVMKLTGQTTVVDPNPYVSRMDGANGVDYAAIVLCPGKIDFGGRMIDYDPPMDWTLSGEAKRYIENSLIPGTGACDAEGERQGDRRRCQPAWRVSGRGRRSRASRPRPRASGNSSRTASQLRSGRGAA